MAEKPQKRLKVAVIYSYGANEEETDGILDEENPEDLQSALHVLVHPNMGLTVRIVKRPGAELIDIALIIPEYPIHSLRVPITGGVDYRKRKKLLALVSGFLHTFNLPSA